MTGRLEHGRQVGGHHRRADPLGADRGLTVPAGVEGHDPVPVGEQQVGHQVPLPEGQRDAVGQDHRRARPGDPDPQPGAIGSFDHRVLAGGFPEQILERDRIRQPPQAPGRRPRGHSDTHGGCGRDTGPAQEEVPAVHGGPPSRVGVLTSSGPGSVWASSGQAARQGVGAAVDPEAVHALEVRRTVADANRPVPPGVRKPPPSWSTWSPSGARRCRGGERRSRSQGGGQHGRGQRGQDRNLMGKPLSSGMGVGGQRTDATPDPVVGRTLDRHTPAHPTRAEEGPCCR